MTLYFKNVNKDLNSIVNSNLKSSGIKFNSSPAAYNNLIKLEAERKKILNENFKNKISLINFNKIKRIKVKKIRSSKIFK